MPTELGALGLQAASTAATGATNDILGLVFGSLQDKRQLKQQRKLQDLQIEGEKSLTDYNTNKQLELWKNTSYPAQVEQLKKAGLNPALEYGMGGGGGATANIETQNVQAGQAPQGEQSPHSEGMGMQLALLQSQQALLEAQKRNVDADTANKISENPNIPKQGANLDANTQSLLQGVNNMKAQKTLTDLQASWQAIQNDIAGQTIDDQVKQIQNLANKTNQEVQQLALDNQLSQGAMQDKLKMYHAQLAETIVRAALEQAQRINTDQDTKNKIQELIESQQRVKSMAEHLMIDWDNQSINSQRNQREQWEYQDKDSSSDWDFIKDVLPHFIVPLKGSLGTRPNPIGFKK